MTLKQHKLFKFKPTDHGGELRKKRMGRGARPLPHRHSLHLVLRSTNAFKDWSMTYKTNRHKIKSAIKRFANRNAIELISFANVGNHIHLHLKLPRARVIKGKLINHRDLYKRFIRALTSTIAYIVATNAKTKRTFKSFFDQRPFSRLVFSVQHFFNMKTYIAVNAFEGQGLDRPNAYLAMAQAHDREHPPNTDED